MNSPLLSLVVPCYNEEETIIPFYEEACRVVEQMDLVNQAEFVFVDDGSRDRTLDVIKTIAEQDVRIHFISFSRNFGKESAIFAGLSKAAGEYTALLDADLQDPPSLLPDFFHAVREEGYDCAASRRISRRNEPPVRSLFARLFYKIMAGMSSVSVVDGARDFRLMSRKYKEAVLSLKEKNRFTKGIFPWVGFNTKWFEYENIERVAGTTKWSFWKLFLYSIDGIVGFSTKPLAFAAVAGVFSLFIAFIMTFFIVVRKLVWGDPVQGWASLVCIIVFIGGIQMFTSGIIGIYLSKIYTEVKSRPLYIIKEEH